MLAGTGERRARSAPSSAVISVGGMKTLQVSNLESLQSIISVPTQSNAEAAPAVAPPLPTISSEIVSTESVLASLAPISTPATTIIEQSVKQTNPVYNAIFSPTVPNQPDHLLDGQSTTLRFLIGPHNPSSVIANSANEVAPEIRSSAIDVPLTVTMTCKFCEGKGDNSSVQVRRIVYHSEEQTSSAAQFRLLPRRALAVKELGANEVLLEVRDSKTAVRYNTLAISVAVDSSGSPTSNVAQSGMTLTSFPGPVSDNRTFRPDLIITIVPQTNGPIQISFDPINPELASRLNGLDNKRPSILKLFEFRGRDSEAPQPRLFPTQDFSDKELSSLEADAKSILRGITDRENDALQQALAASLGGSLALDSVDLVAMGSSDKDKILDSLLPLGQYVYSRLFNGNSDLRKIIESLESFSPSDAHTVRILIKARGPVFPWQLLNDPSSLNGEGFWGLKYELAVEPLDRISQGTVFKTFQPGGDGTYLFGIYKGSDYSVTYYAKQQSDYLTQKMHLVQPVTAESATSFTQKLKDGRSSLDFVLVYTHGSDGYVNTTVGNVNVSLPLDPPGQRLIFSQDANAIFVKPVDLLKLTKGVDLRLGPFFERGPVVLLNACETGVLSSDQLTLPEALIVLGARGVVATVAPIPNKFGFQFGDALIDQMAKGVDLAKAMHDITKVYWRQGNPLGLIYSYYSYDGIAIPEHSP